MFFSEMTIFCAVYGKTENRCEVGGGLGELSTFKHSTGALQCTTSSRERLKTSQPGTAPPPPGNTHHIFLEVKPRYKVWKCPPLRTPLGPAYLCVSEGGA